MKTYPLTQSQLGVILECIKYPSSTQYNLPTMCELADAVDTDALVRAFNELICSKAILRAHFCQDDAGQYYQYPDDTYKADVIIKDLSNEQAKSYIGNDFVRPFDVLCGKPLYRIEIIKTESTKYLLMDFHHLVMDAFSYSTLVGKELNAFYEGAIKPLDISYYEYAETEKERFDTPKYIEARDYFIDRFKGTDFVSISNGNSDVPGKMLTAGAPLSKAMVDDWCSNNDVAADILFQAAFSHVLGILSRQDEVTYCSAYHGRLDRRMMKITGMFINNLPVKAEVSSQITVKELLSSLKEEMATVYSYGLFPMSHLNEALGIAPKISYNFRPVKQLVRLGDTLIEGSELIRGAIISDMNVHIELEGDDYVVVVDSSENVNSGETVEMFADAVKTVVCNMMASPDAKLSDIALVDSEEVEEILRYSKGETLSYNESETFVDMFVQNAGISPSKIAVVDENNSYTYAELDKYSDCVAGYLIDKNFKPGDFAAIFMGRTGKFLIAVLGIMKAGGAYIPIDGTYPKERIEYMLSNSGAAFNLNEETVDEAVGANKDTAAPVNLSSPDKHAYMIYTSGSTGKPKGVMQSHRSLRAFIAWRIKEIGITKDSIHAEHASLAFDASLDDLICPLAIGGTVHILSDDLRKDIEGMHEYFCKNHITGLTMSTQMGMAMINAHPESSLKFLMMGGEKMLPFAKTDIKVINGYGPTEFTVCSSFHVVNQDADTNIPIGRPVPNTYSLIVDKSGNLLPKSAIGELCLAGPQLADGYYKLPEVTNEKFRELNGGVLKGVKVYHTGDLASYNENGELEYQGRIDFQVKLRGYRIELGEIENRAKTYEGIDSVCAQVKSDMLVLYYTAKSEIAAEELKKYLAETLAEYMVPESYMLLDKMPLTPNGKIDTKALPEPVFFMEEIVECKTKLQADILNLVKPYVKVEELGITNNLVSLGLTSLSAIKLCSDLSCNLNVNVKASDILKNPTVEAIEALAGTENGTTGLRHVEARDCYPLSENQRGVYLDWEIKPDTTRYNIPNVTKYEGADVEKLRNAVIETINAHSYIKTRLGHDDEDVVQIPHADEEVRVDILSAATLPTLGSLADEIRPFNLFDEPLYRIKIYTYENDAYLFMDVHHIVYDGMSLSVIKEDIKRAYNGQSLEEEKLTAYDLAVYEKELLASEIVADVEKRYDVLFSEANALIYSDSKNPDNVPAASVIGRIDKEGFEPFCAKNNVTLNSFMQAAFAETMHRLTREENFVYLTVNHGRGASIQLNSSVGMFVKTVPVAVKIADTDHGNQKIEDFVKLMHEELQQNFESDFYSYTKVVDRYKLHGEVMFVFQGGMDEDFANQVQEGTLGDVKTPVELTVYTTKSQMMVEILYDGNRYGKKDMDILLDTYLNVAGSMLKTSYIREVKLLDEAAEAEMINGMCKGPVLDYDKSKTWLSLFADNVAKRPDHLAVLDEYGSITYKELDEQSNAIAHYIIENGVEPNDFVIIKMDRVKEFVVSVLGVHKAGACYVPIDPGYPADRIQYMQEDSMAKVVLTEKLVSVIFSGKPDYTPIDIATPDNLAYMIYTSGSTGKPKGAMIPHFALMNYLMHYIPKFGVTYEDRVSHHITWSFDSHIRDLFPALGAGAGLYIMPESIRKDPDEIYAFLEKYQITGSAYATAMGQLMLNSFDLKQKFISVGGEALRGVRGSKIKVFNVCGATEVTDVVVDYMLEDGVFYDDTPIGKPLANCYAFILDKYGNLVPRGIPGEICYSGANIGAGYWHLPEKTKAVFTDSPFVPGERMYHTGDLGRYNDDEDVEYLGRLDFQVKLRGFRIELGEIESNAIRYEGMKIVAAAVVKDRLCLYYFAESKIDADDLKDFLAKSLTAYMVPTVYMQLDNMPMTPSGKVNRKALPEPDVQSSEDYVEPEGEVEASVALEIQKLLGMETKISALDSFFALGGDSIKAIRLVSALRKVGIEVKVADIMKEKTVRNIAQAAKVQTATGISEEPISGTVFNRRWLLSILKLPRPEYYHQTAIFKCGVKIDADALTKAWNAVTYQHDMLRCVLRDNELYIRPAEETVAIITKSVVDFDELKTECLQLKSSVVMSESLVKIALFTVKSEQYLFIAAHHLVIDGVSWRIIISDLEIAYEKALEGYETVALPAKTNTYRDFEEALTTYRNSYALSLEIPYWKNVQSSIESIPTSSLYDFDREFKEVKSVLDEKRMKEFVMSDGSRFGTDINDLLLTAVARSYQKVFGQSSLSVQFEGHGREDIGANLAIDRTVGWFTSLYPVFISNISGSLKEDIVTVKEALHRVPNKGVGYNVLRNIEGDEKVTFDKEHGPVLSFNYLGEMDEGASGEALFTMKSDIDTGMDRAEENYFGPDLAVDCIVVKGEFTLTLNYNTALADEKKAQCFADSIIDEMGKITDMLKECSKERKTPTDLGECEWSVEEFDNVIKDFGDKGISIERIYPLTPMQESMLLKNIMEPDSFAYRLASIWELGILPTGEQLENVVNKLAARHEVLRTSIIYKGVSHSRQAITDRPLEVHMADLSDKEDKEEAVRALRMEILANDFDLQDRSLVQLTCAKTSENSCYLILATHHIIVDGWCMQILLTEMMQLIDDEITGAETLKAVSETTGVYEKAVREILAKDLNKGLSYWSNLLSDYETKAEIPSWGEICQEEQSKSDEVSVTIDVATVNALSDICKKEGATINNAVELAWGMVLSAYSRCEDAVFVKVVSGRDNTGISVDNVMGLFINSVPVRVRMPKEATARQALLSLSKQAADSNEYDYCPLSEVLNRTDLGNNLFQSIMAFENYGSGSDNTSLNFSYDVKPMLLKEENFDEIAAKAYEEEDGSLSFSITFNKKHFRKVEIERALNMFKVITGELALKPDEPLCTLHRLNEEQISEMLKVSKGIDLEYDRTLTWIDMFMANAASDPDNVAVVDRSGSYTYAELDEKSNNIACYLEEKGVMSNDFVAIKLPRIKEFVAALIGVNKAGAAYVPIDPEYPENRIEYMLNDCKARVCLSSENVAEAMEDRDGVHNPINKATPSTNAYMIYTSGSTGNPKGVMLKMRAISACAAWLIPEFSLGKDKRNLHHPSFSFDASTFDLFYPLAAGGQIHILDEALRKDMDGISDYIVRNGITGMTMSTAIGMALLNQYDIKLDYIMLGGEKFMPVKKSPTRLYNGYGPTEFTVCSSFHIIDQDKDIDIPIGRAVANSYSIICDRFGHVLPKGAAGELCLVGEQISEGYWGRDELNAVSFAPLSDGILDGVRAYHTGDLARYNEDGELEYLGRIDTQVKLRGFRIELGEVENAASLYEGILQVAAEVKKDQLCLYYSAETEIDRDKLKNHMAATLTEYMVPTVFIELEELPLTPNGKVNRRALPEPVFTSSEDYVEPEGEAEIAVAKGMQKILGLERMPGANDNFFELGGDSIKAIRLISILRSDDISLQVSDIMKLKSVRAIAALSKENKNTLVISTEPIEGEVTDTAIFEFFKDLSMPIPNHFNQTVLLKCRSSVDKDALRKSIDALTYQHDMLRAILVDGKLSIRNAETVIPIEEVNIESDSITDLSLACENLQASIKPEESLLRVVLFDFNKDNYLFILAHHVIVDGVSWRIITSDLELGYSQALAGKEIKLPLKTHTYNDYAKALKEYRNSYKLSRQIPYWTKVQEKLMSTALSMAKDYSRDFDGTIVKLDRADTAKFLGANMKPFSIDVNDYLLACVGRSYCRIFECDSFSAQFEGHGREDIGGNIVNDRTVGWFTSVYPVVVENMGKGIAEDLVNVKESLHRVPDKGIGYNVLRFIEGKEKVVLSTDKVSKIGFNYMGEMDAERSNDAFFSTAYGIDTGFDFAKENMFGPDLAINCVVNNGEFSLSLFFNKSMYKPAVAEAFAKGILEEMLSTADFLNNCDKRVITASDLGENEWTEDEFEKVVAEFSERDETIERIYPLTSMQEGMLLKAVSEPSSWAYRLVSVFEIDTLLTENQLQNALLRLANKHEVLRTAIIHEGVSVPRQAIVTRKLTLNMLDYSDMDNPQEAVLNLRKEILTNAFDLQRRPLMQLTYVKKDESSAYIVVATHHSIVDGWCISLYMSDLVRFINEEKNGEMLTLEVDDNKGRYEAAVREILDKDKFAAVSYWKKLLADFDTKSEIPSYHNVPEDMRSDEDVLSFSLGRENTLKLTELCRSRNATLNNGVELIWGLVLSTYSGTKDAVFVKVVSGRDNTETDVNNLVGLFINSVPVRVKYDDTLTTQDMLTMLQKQTSESSEYDYCPLSDISNCTDLGSDFYQSVMAFENYNSGSENGSDNAGTIAIKPIITKEESFADMDISALIENDELKIMLTFDNTKYCLSDIKKVQRLFETIMCQMINNPDTPVAKLNRVDKEETSEVLKVSTGEELILDGSRTWISMFKEQAALYPDSIALIDEAGSYTYAQLDEYSDHVAAYLINKGIKENDFIAIMMGRTKDFLVAALGAHKAGIAYVPIDTDYPKDRIEYILENSEAGLTLSEDNIREAYEFSDALRDYRLSPDHLAYMIYTSGSTGKPKGVMIKHRSLYAFVNFIRNCWELSRDSRITCHSNFAFDASVEDLYPVLTAGGRLYIVPDAQRKDVGLMRDYINENHITGGCYTTQFAQLMSTDEPIDLKYIVLGGEKMTSVPNITGRVINTYGPTEFTVDATYYEIDKDREYDNIPIGRPLYNSIGIIVDKNDNILPLGIAGELCLSGPQLSAGYMKLPDKTKEVFKDLNLPNGDTIPVYHTGDLARYNEEGELEYIGRIDTQVKLRGFRIELGEIEAVAIKYKNIRQAAAQVRGDKLILYYTCDMEPDEEELKLFLGQSLAEYMVPSVYMCLDEFPYTPNGKVNLKALPDPVIESHAEYIPPEGDTEIKVASCMKEVLGISGNLGALDNFFNLGGDSIKAIRLVSALRNEGVSINVSDVMKGKTVRNIAGAAGKESISISEDAISGAVEDSAIVKYFFDINMPRPNHFNQSQILSCRDRVDTKGLNMAINAIVYQHDMLRAVVVDNSLNVRPGNYRINVIEHECADEEIERICNDYEKSFDLSEGLFKVILIHGKSEDVLFMVAHHLIIDGVSWRIILSDLEVAYAQAVKGAAVIKLEHKTHTYRDYAEALVRYRNSYGLSLEIPYWKKVSDKLMSSSTSKCKDYTRRIKLVRDALNIADTKALIMSDNTKFGTDINDLLLTALGRAYHEVFNKNSVSVQLEGHGRENIGEKLVTDRTVGWFTSIYPVVLEGIDGDIKTDLIRTKETLHRVPNKGVGYNVLRYLEGEEAINLPKDDIAQISFNYLGEMNNEDSDGFFKMTRDINVVDSDWSNVTDSDLAVNALVMDGEFKLFVAYNEGKFKAEEAQLFVTSILKEITVVTDYIKNSNEKVVSATDLGENEWSDTEFNAVVYDFAARGEKIERIYPLTPMQEGMLLKAVSEPDSFAYRLVDIYELGVLPTEEMLRKVLDRLANKHEVLRTSIIHEQVKVARQAITNRRLGLEIVDISGTDNPKEEVLKIRLDILANKYDLQRKPLMHITCAKKDENSCYLVIAIHHIIVDGWCNSLYLADLLMFLGEEISGKYSEDVLPEKGAYESAVREILRKDKKKGLKYWTKLLDDYNTKTEIPHYGTIPMEKRSASEEVTIKIDADVTGAFNSLCKESMATISNGAELAWGLVLQTYSRTDDSVFVKVVSGRDNTDNDVSSVVGLFINSIPVRVKVDETKTARMMLEELSRQSAESNAYDFCPLSEIEQCSELGRDLFQTVFAFENYNSADDEVKSFDDLSYRVKPLLVKEEIFDEVIPACYMEDGKLCMRITFNTEYYYLEDMQRVLTLFETFIKNMVASPDTPLVNMSRMGDAAFEEVLALSEGEVLDYDYSKTWIDYFKENVKKNPAHMAVCDETSSATYEELDRESDKIAAYLAGKGIGENDFVVIKIKRNKEFVYSYLGIEKAGAAYIPVPPEYPEDRIAYMIKDSQAKVVLDEELIKEILSGADVEEFKVKATKDTLAYMIYTSGSTGLPKGVMIPQRALTNFVHFYIKYNNLNENSRVCCHTNFAFDASVKDLVAVFVAGGTLYVIGDETRKDLDLVRTFLVKNEITGGNFVTQIAHILTTDEPLPLSYMTLGGEKMVKLPNITGQVMNMYGPTEFTCDALYHIIDKERTYSDIPLGRPLPNLSVFLVDARDNLVPRGVSGEICMAGVQMATGYWKLPEKTASVFKKLRLPDGREIDVYHTGDLAHFNEDGDLVYGGRIDFQVKLRGFRIELGEIESKAASYEDVKQTIALVRGDQIVLYYTAGSKIDVNRYKSYLAKSLAEYMVPQTFMQLDEMPMTPNGKINRKALPEGEISQNVENVKAASPTEQLYLDIAREFIPGVEFGVTDNLFNLGMSSLAAMKFSSRLHEINSKIRVSDIMRYGNVRDLVAGASRITWITNTIDDAKPTIVVIAGIIPIKPLLDKIRALGNIFNVIVIEPVTDHYSKIFESEDFDEVVEFYMTQIMMYIGDNKVFGIMGFSFGGVIAGYLAGRIRDEMGYSPKLVLGDSYFRDNLDRQNQFLADNDEDMKKCLGNMYTQYTKTREIINKLGTSKHTLKYDGHTVFLNACISEDAKNDTEDMDYKLSQFKKRFTDAEIIDFKNHTHEGLFIDSSLTDTYMDIWKKMLE